jgi:hypothetical protein
MFELGFEPLEALPAGVIDIEAVGEVEAADSIGVRVPAIVVAATS